MNVLVFSDSHLVDTFDKRKYIFLKKIIEKSDLVIINGDFWDGYLTTFEKFINSDWKSLFPLLKSRKAVYLFGNHDKREYADRRMDLFSDRQVDEYELRIGSKSYIFEHGHLLSPSLDDKVSSRKVNKVMTYIAHSLLFKKLFESLGLEKRHNIEFKKKIKAKTASNTIFAFGHSHFPEEDIENSFINSGYILHKQASYIIITENSLELRSEKY